MDWQKIWDTIVQFFNDNIWNIVKFFSVLVIGGLFIFVLMRILKAIFRRKAADSMAVRFVLSIIRFILWFSLVLVLMTIVGIEVNGLTTAMSAIVLAIGVALKDNVSNLANGLILVSSKKYKVGDYVIVGEVEGSIVEINFLFTTLRTADGRQVLMPNGTMVNSQVINNGAFPKRRINLTFSVAYDSDVEKVKSVILGVMASDGRIYEDPAPLCHLKTLGTSSLDFFSYCWVDGEDYWDVYYFLMETIFNELKRNGIAIPYQQAEVRIRQDTVQMPVIEEALTPRVEKKRAAEKKRMSIEELEDAKLNEIVLTKKKSNKKKASK